MSPEFVGWPGRTIRTIALLSTGVAAALAPSASRAQSMDEKAVVSAVERFFEGMLKADSMLMKSTVAAGARLTSVANRDGTPTLNVISMDQFITSAGSRPPGTNEKVYRPEVRIDGDLATVWTFYTLHVGERFIHCGIDAFQLLRDGDTWRIVSLAFTTALPEDSLPKGGTRP